MDPSPGPAESLVRYKEHGLHDVTFLPLLVHPGVLQSYIACVQGFLGANAAIWHCCGAARDGNKRSLPPEM